MTNTRSFDNFRRCVDEAPDGACMDAKALSRVLGDACDNLMAEIRTLGFKADNCDLIYQVEAAMYEYVKRSNPDSGRFAVAEGFGEAMDGLARERVLRQAEEDRDFLAEVNNG